MAKKNQGQGRGPGGPNPNPNPRQGGGDKAAPKLFVSGTRDNMRVRITYFVGSVGQTMDFQLCFGPAGDPCAFAIGTDPTNPQTIYTVKVVDGEGFCDSINLTGYEHLNLKKVAVKLAGGREFSADLPEDQPAPATAGSVAQPTKKTTHSFDDLFVVAQPVVGSATNEWKIEVSLQGGGKPSKDTVVLISHPDGGQKTTNDQGKLDWLVTPDKNTKVAIAPFSDPELAEQIQLLGPESTPTTTAAGTPSRWQKLLTFAKPAITFWTNINNTVFVIMLLLGMWITVRTGQDMLQKVFFPSQMRAGQTNGTTMTPAEARKARLDAYNQKHSTTTTATAKANQPKAVRATKEETSYTSEFFTTVLIFGDHDRGGFKREIICLLFWIPFLLPFMFFACFYDEIIRWFSEGWQAADMKIHGFSAERKRREYRVRREAHEGHFHIIRYVDGKVVTPPVTEPATTTTTTPTTTTTTTEAGPASLIGKLLKLGKGLTSFGVRDLIFNELFRLLGHIFPSLKKFL